METFIYSEVYLSTNYSGLPPPVRWNNSLARCKEASGAQSGVGMEPDKFTFKSLFGMKVIRGQLQKLPYKVVVRMNQVCLWKEEGIQQWLWFQFCAIVIWSDSAALVSGCSKSKPN